MLRLFSRLAAADGLDLVRNPFLLRALKIGARPGRVGAAIPVQAVLLAFALLLADALVRSTEPFFSTAGIGWVAFFLFSLAAGGLTGFVAPMLVLGFLDLERRQRSLDQLVLSGVSPGRCSRGRLCTALLVLLLFEAAALPFYGACAAFGGPPTGWALAAPAIFFFFGAALYLCSAALALWGGEVAAMAGGWILASAALAVGFIGAFAPVKCALYALSPVYPLFDAMAARVEVPFVGGVLSFASQPIALFGASVPPVAVFAGFWGLIGLAAFAYLHLGTDFRLGRDVNVFGLAPDAPRLTRFRQRLFGRRVGNPLARAIETAFFFENRPGFLRRHHGWIRRSVGTLLGTALFLFLVGSVLPVVRGANPQDLPAWLGAFTLIYGIFCGLTGGAMQRHAIQDAEENGGRPLWRVALGFFALRMAVPGALLALLAREGVLQGPGLDQAAAAYAVALAVAAATLGLTLLASLRTIVLGKVQAFGFLAGFVLLPLLPLLWRLLYAFNLVPASSHAVLEAAPTMALTAVFEPFDAVYLEQAFGDNPLYRFYPRLWPCLVGCGAVAALSLGFFAWRVFGTGKRRRIA